MTTPTLPSRTAKERRTALAASFLGTTVEFYDFVLYATAATLVFPALFFNDVDHTTGVILSYLTLAAGYVARPLGALLFGHFGDKYGRKKMLVTTMVIMGVVSVCMGLMPTANAIGTAAPIILVVLRILQGIAMGGEWGGATLMAMEYSDANKKGLGAAISMIGGPAGVVIASFVFAQFARLPEEQFMTWGWRIPFLASFLLVFIAILLRRAVRESPEFEAAQREREAAVVAAPKSVFRGQWKRMVLCIIVGASPLFLQSLSSSYFVSSGVEAGHDRSDALLMVTAGSFLQIIFVPVIASLSDRLGRQKVLGAGFVIAAIGIIPVLGLVHSTSFAMFALGFMLGMAMNIIMYAPLGAYLGEQFATANRYTGVSLSYQITTLLTGFGPAIAVQLGALAGGGWSLTAAFFIGLCVLGFAALMGNRALDRRSDAQRVPAADLELQP